MLIWAAGSSAKPGEHVGGDGLQHADVTGIRAIRSWPVSDDIGEAQLPRATGHLLERPDAREGELRRRVEAEVPLERRWVTSSLRQPLVQPLAKSVQRGPPLVHRLHRGAGRAPARAMLDGKAQRARTVGSNDERDPWLLDRAGQRAGVICGGVRAAVGD